MGSCISKCFPRKNPHDETSNNNVQDKLVISQAPITPIPHTKKPLSPSPSPISTSSFSCATSNISGSSFTSSLSLSSSSSLSSSCSASTISSKERSFSNDFIWSCVKENQHVIGVDNKLVPNKVYVQKLNSTIGKPVCATPKQSTPKKRARANSPTLTRQKSLRKEVPPERANGAYSNVPSRTVRSPSPGQRFSGKKLNYKGAFVHTPKEKCSFVSKGNISRNCTGKENVRPASPNNNFSRNRVNLRNRETYTHRIGIKIDETEVQEGMSNEDINSIPREDIDNPLIALDCFIFL